MFVAVAGDHSWINEHAQECREVKAWKKVHSLGIIPNVPVHLLREPSELYAARERDESHVVDLMESFMEKDSINRKGIKVAVLSKGLWNTWERSTEAQRAELLQKNCDFYKVLMSCELGVPTGDHTREAIQRLAKAHPHVAKYKTIKKGIKFFLCEGTPEDLRMLRLFGNIDNAKRELQRKLDFPSKVLQMHRAAIQFDTMAETGGAKGQKKAKDARAAAIKSWCGQWRCSYEKVYPLWTLANLKGEMWGLIWKIIMGNYPNSRKGPTGSFRPTRLSTSFHRWILRKPLRSCSACSTEPWIADSSGTSVCGGSGSKT